MYIKVHDKTKPRYDGTIQYVHIVYKNGVEFIDPSVGRVFLKEGTYKEADKCPICGEFYDEYPALSRKDNKTPICPDCGLREALEAMASMEGRCITKNRRWFG